MEFIHKSRGNICLVNNTILNQVENSLLGPTQLGRIFFKTISCETRKYLKKKCIGFLLAFKKHSFKSAFKAINITIRFKPNLSGLVFQ
jgi:hypothetical protein